MLQVLTTILMVKEPTRIVFMAVGVTTVMLHDARIPFEHCFYLTSKDLSTQRNDSVGVFHKTHEHSHNT